MTPMDSSERKLVVFSDSRQDAAKLSAGMRFSHYRDALRQALAAEQALPAEQLICGNGSEELIDVVGRCFVRPGDGIARSIHHPDEIINAGATAAGFELNDAHTLLNKGF